MSLIICGFVLSNYAIKPIIVGFFICYDFKEYLANAENTRFMNDVMILWV